MKLSLSLWTAALSLAATSAAARPGSYFRRASTFPVCRQDHPDCDADGETGAETLWFLPGGGGLVYTDSAGERLGFVDAADPANPVADGTVDLGGEPTTVRVVGGYVVVGVNTSPDFVNPSGHLAVIDADTRAIVRTIDLGGQPDAVDVTKPGSAYPWHVVVAIENERDEDLGDGTPPQLPGGKVTIVDIADAAALADPSLWTVRDVIMTDLAGCDFPEDPEPEYVAIDAANENVVVTLQENNCNALINLAAAAVTVSFNAGAVALADVDLTEDGLISQSEATAGELNREPDGVAWVGATNYFATANEGDLNGGSRGWSIVSAADGTILYDAGNSMEHEVARIGHYPDERSENKGNEPENVLYADVDGTPTMFVCSERASVVFVYDVSDPAAPVLEQTLPVGLAPEGLAYDATAGVLAVASEKDSRAKKHRSSIALFRLARSAVPEYPTLVSAPRAGAGPGGPYIPFSALSGLAAAAPLGVAALATEDTNILYAVEDSFYKKSRIFTLDVGSFPAVLEEEMRITDANGVLAACLAGNLGVDVVVGDLVNDDTTVNLDPEGIAVAAAGGFWIASEGRGTVDDAEKPFEYPNLLLKLTAEAVVAECVLPDAGFQAQVRFGFEGVAEDGDHVVIALQRKWGDEEHPRIAVYDTVSGTWKYAFYPLDAPASQNGGWVGLSDIAPAGPGSFYLLERDNQGGPDAAIKKVYMIELGDYTFGDGTVLVKELYRDLVPDLLSRNGQVFEKVEGLAITACGAVWVNNDNDGVDDNSGEQALLNVATVTTVPAKVGKKATKCSKSAKTAAPTRAKKVKNSKKR